MRKKKVSDEEFIKATKTLNLKRSAYELCAEEIAEALNISVRTVYRYAQRLGIKIEPKIHRQVRVHEFARKILLIRSAVKQQFETSDLRFCDKKEGIIEFIMDYLSCSEPVARKWYRFLLLLDMDSVEFEK